MAKMHIIPVDDICHKVILEFCKTSEMRPDEVIRTLLAKPSSLAAKIMSFNYDCAIKELESAQGNKIKKGT